MGGEIYDAALNQTNVGDNNNKFYVIQVLESDDGGKFLVYNRWGRVGKKGQDKLQDNSSRESAIQEFEQKFLAKTKNAWSDRNNFVFHPKSYAWLDMDYSGKEKESKVALGEMAELLTGDHDADRLPEGKLSTKGVGATAPDFSKAQELEDGLIVPLGKPKTNSRIKLHGDLLHNEYIVYNVEQIRMRYVVNVKFWDLKLASRPV